MTSVLDFIKDISGVDGNIASLAAVVLTIGLVLVTINFCLGIVTYIFKPKI